MLTCDWLIQVHDDAGNRMGTKERWRRKKGDEGWDVCSGWDGGREGREGGRQEGEDRRGKKRDKMGRIEWEQRSGGALYGGWEETETAVVLAYSYS